MKIICSKRKWKHKETDSASALIAVILDNGLIEKYWQNHLTGLALMLSSGIPTPRNKQAAHGQGVDIQKVPQHIAGYVLHQTAATILMLAEADKNLP